MYECHFRLHTRSGKSLALDQRPEDDGRDEDGDGDGGVAAEVELGVVGGVDYLMQMRPAKVKRLRGEAQDCQFIEVASEDVPASAEIVSIDVVEDIYGVGGGSSGVGGGISGVGGGSSGGKGVGGGSIVGAVGDGVDCIGVGVDGSTIVDDDCVGNRLLPNTSTITSNSSNTEIVTLSHQIRPPLAKHRRHHLSSSTSVRDPTTLPLPTRVKVETQPLLSDLDTPFLVTRQPPPASHPADPNVRPSRVTSTYIANRGILATQLEEVNPTSLPLEMSPFDHGSVCSLCSKQFNSHHKLKVGLRGDDIHCGLELLSHLLIKY